MTTGAKSLLSARISALVADAPNESPEEFATRALPLLMEANNALAALVEAFGWMRVLAHDERLHEEISEERIGVEGCEACDVIIATDKALAEALA